ncbi:AraC family transcriptional regulator [Staphylococcus simulans]|uniref:helix-turn-helix domain-containing protein n=1 Tax=Staphylococcus simulans TaxID=1286 RepID=UPI001E3BB2DF|nr:AraC family transcriptional regulator [Staphylococcus simulans]MCD8915928.1 AraC family transcriptional regulator [Staphylococcus simulans]
MEDKTIEMLKTHAIYLLGLDMKVFDIQKVDQIIKEIKTPFMNHENKQLKKALKQYIQEMSSQHIYFYTNAFNVHYYIFKYRKQNKLITIGPFLNERPTERQSHEMLQEAGITISKMPVLKQYLLSIPVCNRRDALKMTRLAVRFIKNRDVTYEVIPFTLQLHTKEMGYTATKDQYQFALSELEERYKVENQLITAIENGDAEGAFNCFIQLSSAVSGLRRANDYAMNEKYKAYILNTLGRKAIEKAGANLLVVDQVSKKYAAEIDGVLNMQELHDVMHSQIIEYTEIAQKVKQYEHTPKVNKVLQYIDLNLDQPLTLQCLAEMVELSPAYLSRVFSDELGVTLSQYIIKVRIKVGRDLLVRTKMSVADIAKYVGFKDQSYFTQRFKEVYGMSPLKYRKNNVYTK